MEEPIIYTIPISKQNKEFMKTLGVMIRKFEKDTNGKYKNVSKKNLKKQIHTLHKKLKKVDCVYIEFSIEKDNHSNIYHTHLIIQHNGNKKEIQSVLSKYIGGVEWKTKAVGLEVYDVCNGKYGCIDIDIEPIRNIDLYKGYINKYEISKQLY